MFCESEFINIDAIPFYFNLINFLTVVAGIDNRADKMKKMVLLVTLLYSYLCCSLVYAASPIWKVSRGEDYIYIGGTIHLLAATDYPLPNAFAVAYADADKLLFETDLQKLQAPSFGQSLLAAMAYGDGKTLKTELSKSTFKSLEDYLNERDLSISSFLAFKPPMVLMTITLLELSRLGLGGVGVDAFYHAKAMQSGKRVGYLETVAQQLDFISNMGRGRDNELVQYSLQDIKVLPIIMRQLKDAWRLGDISQLETIAIKDLQHNFPQIYKNILVDRNLAWMPKLESMFSTKEIAFIMVGALHLAGEDGLLKQFKNKGYSVKMLD